MKATEANTKTPSNATGFFATLCGPPDSKASGVPKFSLNRLATLMLLCLLVLSVTTGVAQAAGPPEEPTTLSPAKSITAISAVFEGVLNPHDKALVGGYFAFSEPDGLTCAEGPTAGLEGFEGEQEVKAQAVHTTVGLEPHATYKFCLVATSGEGATAGNEVTVETEPAPPAIQGESRREVTATSATLEAYINPNNESTKYVFEYSTTEVDKQLSGTISKLSGEGELTGGSGQAAEAATGAALSPGTTYYYRIVAENAQSKAEHKPVEGVVEQFTTVPTPTTESVTALEGTTATLNGRLAPLNPNVGAGYHFDYNLGGTCTGGSATPTGEVGKGPGGDISEATPVTGLEPDTIYTVCFVTSNERQGSVPITGAPVTFRTPPEAYVTEVTSSSVVLHALLDPEGSATTYRFQYGPSSEYGSETPEAGAGSGSSPVAVEADLQGLSAASVYHYRVITTNAAHESFASEDETFTALPAGTTLGSTSTLTDNRQYELVSPPDKHGALVEPIGPEDVIETSAEGSAFTYITSAPTEVQPQGNANASQILATRTADGWTDQDIATPNATDAGVTVGNGQEYKLFSPDLSRAIVEPLDFTPYVGEEASPYATETTPYLREDFVCPSATCYTPLLTTTDVTSGAKFGQEVNESPPDFGAVRGATADLSHVVLNVSKVPLTKATPTAPETPGLYEWSAAEPPAKQLQLVSVLPAAEGGGGAEAFALGTGKGNGAETRNAISSDGSRIVWTAIGGGAGPLYMRDTTTEETVRLDLPEPECLKAGTCGGDPGATGQAPMSQFDMASDDGSTVFFTDTQRLTADSRAGYNEEKAGDAEPDLYACNMVEMEEAGHKQLKCDLTDLTPDGNPGEERAAVQGAVLAASEDGSYVYFVANGVLGDGAAHGAITGNCNTDRYAEYGKPGTQCNLYVEHYNGATETWEAPRFIAALSGADVAVDGKFGNLGAHTSGASPDGRYLAFMSDRDLTRYDTADANSAEPDEEVYLYDAVTSKLMCASCNPTGARPNGERYYSTAPQEDEENENMRFVGGYDVWAHERWLAANIPGWVMYSGRDGAHQPRYLSNSGRLFFNSHEALVPQDVNGTWDVYEYEPPSNGGEGEGDCTTATQGSSDVYDPRAAGCVGLISSGESSEESAFLDASESGGDVFFTTLSQLVPQDIDHSVDVYDAHECTSSAPCFSAAAETPPPCTTEASCKPAPEPPPSIYGLPASATFNGPGNLAPAVSTVVKAKPRPKTVRCKRGYVKKKVKKKESCVRKPRKKKTNAKKSAHTNRGASR